MSKIKELRIHRKWTQAELAEKAGLGQYKISLFERGLKPKPLEMEKLIRAFNLDKAEICKPK